MAKVEASRTGSCGIVRQGSNSYIAPVRESAGHLELVHQIFKRIMPGYVTGQEAHANLLIFRLPAVTATGLIYGLLPVPIMYNSQSLPCSTYSIFARPGLRDFILLHKEFTNLVDDGTGSNAAV